MEWTKLIYNQIQSLWIIILKESFDHKIGLFSDADTCANITNLQHVASHTLNKTSSRCLIFFFGKRCLIFFGWQMIHAYTKNCSQPNSLNDHSTHCPTQQAFQPQGNSNSHTVSLYLSLSKQPCIPKHSKGKISFPPIISITNLLFLFAPHIDK